MLSYYITTTLITLSILLVAWYFLGMWFNRRRGIHLARSLRDRLNALGAEELTGRWVNASIFQFGVRRATSPIGKLAAVAGAICLSCAWTCAQHPGPAWS